MYWKSAVPLFLGDPVYMYMEKLQGKHKPSTKERERENSIFTAQMVLYMAAFYIKWVRLQKPISVWSVRVTDGHYQNFQLWMSVKK